MRLNQALLAVPLTVLGYEVANQIRMMMVPGCLSGDVPVVASHPPFWREWGRRFDRWRRAEVAAASLEVVRAVDHTPPLAPVIAAPLQGAVVDLPRLVPRSAFEPLLEVPGLAFTGTAGAGSLVEPTSQHGVPLGGVRAEGLHRGGVGGARVRVSGERHRARRGGQRLGAGRRAPGCTSERALNP
jgi:hypothetical protein